MMTPDLFSVRVALEKKLFDCLAEEQKSGNIIIIQPGEDIKPDLKKIQIIHVVNPGAIISGELGGRQGVCPRKGAYIITLSIPTNDTKKLSKGLELCSVLESYFYRVDLPIEGYGCCVMCDEPYTMNIGETEDKRLAYSVEIPWWVWAGGYEGD